jgi:Fe-S-cluster containining protein
LGDSDCATCGACCREGFDRVEVRARDLVRGKHAALVSADAFGEFLARPQGRCVALEPKYVQDDGYRCRIYADRPRACAEFEVGGDACLTARRRVGLSA